MTDKIVPDVWEQAPAHIPWDQIIHLACQGIIAVAYTLEYYRREDAVDSVLTPIKEIDAALKACTFGYFHIKLLFIVFVAIVAGVGSSSTTGYLLPVAECDLNMSLVEKGLLNAMPYIGMMLSSIIAGFLTDAFGRKIFLVTGFGGIFIFTVIAATSQTYEVLVVAKFFEGMLFAASFSAMVTLTSEFCHNGIRDRVILCQSSFAATSQIVIALISWGILTQDWKLSLFQGKFVLNTWNFYLYAMSLWSLAACVMYGVFVPESPKYLVTQKKYDEARDILIKVYMQNTGKPADTYPFANIWKDKTKHLIDEEPENQIRNTFNHQIVVALHNIKPMFQKPLVLYLGLICLMNCAIMSMYNVYRLWFPQLSAIVENYQKNYQTDSAQDLCVILDAYTQSLKAKVYENITQLEVCVPTKSGNTTYINVIIIGCVSIVPYFISWILVNKVGKRWLLVTSGLICVATSIGLRWASSVPAIVLLFSVAIAVSQVMLSLSQAFTVEVFGTTTRSLAISLMMVVGRTGAVTGNICFPILLNMGCVIPFFSLGGIMAFVTVLSLFIPSKK